MFNSFLLSIFRFLSSNPLIVSAAGPIKEWCENPADPSCCVVDGVPTLKCLEIVFGNILYMSSFFIIIVLFIMFVVGSFRYLTSFGNAENIKKAQGTLKYALIGFILFVSAFLILMIVQKLFLDDPNNPNDPNKPNLFKFDIGPTP